MWIVLHTFDEPSIGYKEKAWIHTGVAWTRYGLVILS